MAELVPASFEAHVARIWGEHAARKSIYDLPVRKFWLPNPRFDTRARFHGEVAGTPVGPAAGPHTQLAQNLVLSWLAGGRILELKTVQIRDDLVIPRPCIDAATIGYNVEWSQELRLPQSLAEYVSGWTLVHALAASGLEGVPTDRDVLFDFSVGYDLDGIRSKPISEFVAGLMNAGPRIAALRPKLPAAVRDCPIPERIVTGATISTFHGCPADQIAGIAEHLMDAHGLHVVVKLNPTLLGYERVTHLLHDVLGYTDIRTPRSAFDSDLQFDQARQMIPHLRDFAAKRGLHFGVKLSNTLVVDNHRTFFGDPTMYMSGQPLHVIATTLLGAIREAFDFDLPVSFSAGIDKTNFPDAVALGLVPITTCTDLLRTGGYGRLAMYVKALEARMHAVGARRLADYVLRARGHAEAAARRVLDAADPLLPALLDHLAGPQSDVETFLSERGADPALAGRLVAAAARLNTPEIVAAVQADKRYGRAANDKPPSKIGSRLDLFDCVNCDKCVPVCPNDANFSYELAPATLPVWELEHTGGAPALHALEPLVVAKEHQLANFADFCNECGNCDVFCPEDGGPYVLKPRFFGAESAFAEHPSHDGVVVLGPGRALARLEGRRYRLEGDRLDDGVLTVRVGADGRPELVDAAPGAVAGHRLATWPYHVLRMLTAAVLDPATANPVRARVEAPAN
jgi:putative selenate reductase